MNANILASVIGSIIFVTLYELSKHAWSRYLMPLFDSSIAIEGAWVAHLTFPDGDKNKHRITIKRFGHSIWGTAICEDGRGEGFNYTFSGSFYNLIFTAEY